MLIIYKDLINNLKEGERIALITDNVLSDFRKDVFHQFRRKIS